VENAVKIARAYTKRQAVVVFDHGYHGRTNLTMALTAKNMPYKDGFGPFAPEIYRVPMAYPFHWPTGPDNCAEEAAAQAISQIEKQVGANNVAAVSSSRSRARAASSTRRWASCRASPSSARPTASSSSPTRSRPASAAPATGSPCEHEGVVPDLITTAKGLAGGLPLAGVTGRAEIMDAAHSGGLGGTYGGNPVACAAALGAIDTMRSQDLPAAARRIGEIMLPGSTSWPQDSTRSATSAAAAR
jgi:4-aminobutyrate aminotransferase/(S)-3-amino-2-methylpropionate transaminase